MTQTIINPVKVAAEQARKALDVLWRIVGKP